MLATFIKKEITETILDLRFWVVTVLFLTLIPLGMYVSRKDYERRLANYRREHQMYQQRYGKNVNSHVQAQGYRPPSMLSVFALGLDPFMPDHVVTSRSGLFRAVKEPGIDNPQSLLFGKMDFLFNVGFIVSLAALIFAFNCICGEKEVGTLRLMISNPICRGKILLAKIVGNYVVLMIPFLVALLTALLILNASPDISISSSSMWPASLALVLITFLFILVMVSLGICVSTLVSSSIAAVMITFLVWTVLVLGVPKVSPMIAEVIYPIESRSVINLTKRITREDIEKEFDHKKRELFDKCRRECGVTMKGISSSPRNDAERQAYAKYDQELVAVESECQRRIANAIRRIEQDYANRRISRRLWL